jgi:hypothetical protein
VGCSGNFTIERVLADTERRMHGCDVQLYTCAIGWALSGQDFRIEVKDEWLEEYGWLAPYLTSPNAKAATVMLGSRLLEQVRVDGTYFRRMRTAYKADWERLHSETVKKLEDLDINLATFQGQDVAEFFATSPRDAIAISFPPFDKGGYEKMFDGIHDVFDWDVPEYQVLGEDGLDNIVGDMMSHRDWLVGLLHRRPAFDPWYVGKVQPTPLARAMYVYASRPVRRLVVPHQEVQGVPIPRLRAGDRLTGKLGLVPLEPAQFAALRAKYMNPRIKPGTPGAAWAVVDDGRLCGAFAIKVGTTGDNVLQQYGQGAYLLSDFAIDGTDYPRLSKLVVCAAVSEEAKKLYERASNRRQRSISTTAFTMRPVSMKYRSILDLHSRADLKGEGVAAGGWGAQEGFRYKLNYTAMLPKWDLAGAFVEWDKRWGKIDD